MPSLPMPHPGANRRRPKLSLTITSDTRRTFSSKSTFASVRMPQSAMSPTSRNTFANANMARSYSSLNSPAAISFSNSSSSSSDDSDLTSDASSSSECSSPDFGMSSSKEKKRKRRAANSAPHGQLKTKTCHHPTTAAASFLPCPPQPAKRGRSPGARRVRFVTEVTVREFETESDEEEETVTMHERMVAMEQLKQRVMEQEQQANGAGAMNGLFKEGEGWMHKLAVMELEEIRKAEEMEERSLTAGVRTSTMELRM